MQEVTYRDLAPTMREARRHTAAHDMKGARIWKFTDAELQIADKFEELLDEGMGIAEALDEMANYTDTVIYGDVIAHLGDSIRCGHCGSGWTSIVRLPLTALDGGAVRVDVTCHNCGAWISERIAD